MSVLDVPGARLYYETHGSGPLLVMVPGANGTADVFRMVTEHLAARYTVVIYDRRGFSRSLLDGPQDYDRRLETDADDVRRLIAHLGDEPAIVFGASSGAIVALALLTHHPSVVRTIVPFEPPVMRYLPDGQKWLDLFSEDYDLYRESGVDSALALFREHAFPVSDQQVMARAPRNDANAAYWFEHELRQYPAVELDLDALKAQADRIVLAAGREGAGYPAHDVVAELGNVLGRDVIELPGGHVGCVAHPAEFARELSQRLDPRRLTAEARIQTTNASRYLVQLCSHATKFSHRLRRLHGGGSRPEILGVDWTDTHGTLDLSWGKCTLDADPATLTVLVDAADEENLLRVQDIITADLERFGRRDGVTVTWHPVPADA
jgi:pimeloyl-ACP methyl ester carboxylesterase